MLILGFLLSGVCFFCLLRYGTPSGRKRTNVDVNGADPPAAPEQSADARTARVPIEGYDKIRAAQPGDVIEVREDTIGTLTVTMV